MSVVSVSLPDNLLEQADALIQTRGYAGRSELVRAALRDFLAEEAQTPGRDGPQSATLTLVYPEGHERKMGEIRHHYSEIVKSMMHAHTATHCVEVYVLQGKGSRIREFADRLRAQRDANIVQTVYTDLPGAAETGHGHG